MTESNPLYPGQYFDQETGLHQNYFRDYDPRTGRYIQADPIGLRGGLNIFSYVLNNPFKFIDPYGLEKSCYGPIGYSAIGPGQAVGIGAFGFLPPNDSVAISPKDFGLPYDTLVQREATQREIKNNIPSIRIYAPGLAEYLTGETTFTIGDVGDRNIRNSPTPRFDIYRFRTQKDALYFGKETVPTTITGIPDSWSCPLGTKEIPNDKSKSPCQ